MTKRLVAAIHALLLVVNLVAQPVDYSARFRPSPSKAGSGADILRISHRLELLNGIIAMRKNGSFNRPILIVCFARKDETSVLERKGQPHALPHSKRRFADQRNGF